MVRLRFRSHLALALLLGSVGLATAQEEDLRELVQDLGNARWDARQRAVEQLRAHGIEAWDPIRAGTTDPDPEIRSQSTKLLRRIEFEFVQSLVSSDEELARALVHVLEPALGTLAPDTDLPEPFEIADALEVLESGEDLDRFVFDVITECPPSLERSLFALVIGGWQIDRQAPPGGLDDALIEVAESDASGLVEAAGRHPRIAERALAHLVETAAERQLVACLEAGFRASRSGSVGLRRKALATLVEVGEPALLARRIDGLEGHLPDEDDLVAAIAAWRGREDDLSGAIATGLDSGDDAVRRILVEAVFFGPGPLPEAVFRVAGEPGDPVWPAAVAAVVRHGSPGERARLLGALEPAEGADRELLALLDPALEEPDWRTLARLLTRRPAALEGDPGDRGLTRGYSQALAALLITRADDAAWELLLYVIARGARPMGFPDDRWPVWLMRLDFRRGLELFERRTGGPAVAIGRRFLSAREGGDALVEEMRRRDLAGTHRPPDAFQTIDRLLFAGGESQARQIEEDLRIQIDCGLDIMTEVADVTERLRPYLDRIPPERARPIRLSLIRAALGSASRAPEAVESELRAFLARGTDAAEILRLLAPCESESELAAELLIEHGVSLPEGRVAILSEAAGDAYVEGEGLDPLLAATLARSGPSDVPAWVSYLLSVPMGAPAEVFDWLEEQPPPVAARALWRLATEARTEEVTTQATTRLEALVNLSVPEEVRDPDRSLDAMSSFGQRLEERLARLEDGE